MPADSPYCRTFARDATGKEAVICEIMGVVDPPMSPIEEKT